MNGYGSDVTRTWTSEAAHPVFKALCDGMIDLEQQLAASIKPGIPYPDLHAAAHKGVAELLITTGVSSASSANELLENGVAQRFMPHGVGHLLGIQVHDSAGHQSDVRGTIAPRPRGG